MQITFEESDSAPQLLDFALKVITLAKASEEVGVTRQCIWEWQKGLKPIPERHMKKIVSLAQLAAKILEHGERILARTTHLAKGRRKAGIQKLDFSCPSCGSDPDVDCICKPGG